MCLSILHFAHDAGRRPGRGSRAPVIIIINVLIGLVNKINAANNGIEWKLFNYNLFCEQVFYYFDHIYEKNNSLPFFN